MIRQDRNFFYPMCFRDTSVAYGQQITVPFGVEGQWLQVQKKDKYKREGKGRRCCLDRTTVDILHQDDLKKRMNRITAT